MSLFIKYHQTTEARNLLGNMTANHLLSVIAQRTQLKANPVEGIEKGEAKLGDFDKMGMTRQQYRTALENLEKWGYITIRTTTKGTLAKLVNKDVYEVFSFEGNHQNNQQPTNEQPTANQQPTNEQPLDKNIDNKIIEDKKEENYIYLGEFRKIEKGEQFRTTALENHFHFGLFKKEWSENFQNQILRFWRHLEEKKGDNWGTPGTITSQIDAIKSYLQKFSEVEIIEAFEDTRLKGNVSWNPEWTKNNKKAEEEKNPTKHTKQKTNNIPLLEGDLMHLNTWLND